jgi:hypothetical protein
MTFSTALEISAGITGAIIGWYAVLGPLIARAKARKQKRLDAVEAKAKGDAEYRASVINKLDSVEGKIDGLDDSIARLQRDNIERAYCMFVIEHHYCPSGMKSSIQDMYDCYIAKGYNHIARSRVEAIMELPEFPHDIKGKDAYGNKQEA